MPYSKPDLPNRSNGNHTPHNDPQKPRRQRPEISGGAIGATRVIVTIVMVLATLALCLSLAFFILNSASDLFGLNQKDLDVPLTITSGDMTIDQLSDKLVEMGIVEQPFTFKLYAKIKGEDHVIKEGDYTLNTNMSYDQIFSLFRGGDRSSRFVTITFPQYMTIDDMAQLLEESEVCSADGFLEYLQKEEHLGYAFYNRIQKSELRYLKMEGYLFPDTYEFYIGEKIPSVAQKFLDNFQRHIYKDKILLRMQEINMTLDEVVTLASIIQKEADDPDEMRRVSSVFHNRLDSPNFPRLQSDVTLLYAEEHIKGRSRHYTVSETQDVLDAYNTYVREGLPAGPICNPSEEAILAALYPTETSYYYFVTDLKGDYYFATSLAEHNTNWELAKSMDTSGEGHIGGGVSTRNTEDASK